MKNQFTLIKVCITFLLLSFSISASSQSSAKVPAPYNNNIHNTWYEWPHEANGTNTVFKTQKYTPIPGVDKQEDPYIKLIINADGSFTTTQYCGYCPSYTLTEKNGTFSVISSNSIVTGLKVALPEEENNIICNVTSCTADKLIINLPPSIKTK
jgi:hypothetical protein